MLSHLLEYVSALPSDWMSILCYWTDVLPTLWPWLYTAQALAYNVPALLLLGWLLWKRPGMGILITVLAGGRVFAETVPPETVPWSTDACLGTAPLSTKGNGRMGRLGRWAGAALWVWAAYFYKFVFEATLAPIAWGRLRLGNDYRRVHSRGVRRRKSHGAYSEAYRVRGAKRSWVLPRPRPARPPGTCS